MTHLPSQDPDVKAAIEAALHYAHVRVSATLATNGAVRTVLEHKVDRARKAMVKAITEIRYPNNNQAA